MKGCCFAVTVLWLVLVGITRADEDYSHSEWDTILQKRVDDAGQVDYRGLKQDEATLEAYLTWLARTDPSKLSREGQLAYWINAYNAFTVKLILDHYPLKSIKDIPRRWELRNWQAGGKRYSLNQIEHEILRKDFKEPRIHFAIVCASVGCPDLWNHAFSDMDLANQLDDGARRFFLSSKHIRFETRKGAFGKKVSTLHLSSILKWFDEDFTDGGKLPITRFVARYAERGLAKMIFRSGDSLKIKYLDYDWNLNEQR